MNRLQEKYQQKIMPVLQREFKIQNKLAVPKIVKVVINIGIGEAGRDEQALKKAIETLQALGGQKPLVCLAKKAIADFGIRQGIPVGLKVTLRRETMYSFLDKLFSIVLPQVRDFQGVSRLAFDQQGNYTLGFKEQIIFPEVDYDKIDKVRGMEISVVSSTKDKKKARRLLELMGMPFEKIKNQKAKIKNF